MSPPSNKGGNSNRRTFLSLSAAAGYLAFTPEVQPSDFDFARKTNIGPRIHDYSTPIIVIGSYDKDGKPNVMTASFGGKCCHHPPSVMISIREVTYTYENISATKEFTLNIPSTNLVKAVDFFGLVSGRDVDKFEVSGLNAVKGKVVNAPIVAEFPVVMECKVSHIHKVGSHTMFVGEVIETAIAESVLNPDGRSNIQKISQLISGYTSIGEHVANSFSIGRDLISPQND